MSGSVTINTAAGPVEFLDHEFKPYPSTSGVCLADVCSECGDYHDERRQKLQSLADRVSEKYLDRDAGPVDPDAELKVALDAATGLSLAILYNFRECARRLKQTESDYRDAQQAYGEAVKRLSDEAVK